MADNLWIVGALFFGLWLAPMGVSARKAGLPRLLGQLPLFGGVGYVLSAFTVVLALRLGW